MSDTKAYPGVILSKMPFRLLLLRPTVIFMIGRMRRNVGSGTVLPMLGKYAQRLPVSSGVQKTRPIVVVPKSVQRSKRFLRPVSVAGLSNTSMPRQSLLQYIQLKFLSSLSHQPVYPQVPTRLHDIWRYSKTDSAGPHVCLY